MLTIIAYGRLSRDPEIRDTAKSRLASFSLACPVPDGKEAGVAFLDCKAWDPLASIVAGMKKGDPVQMFATAITEKWDGKDGKTHYKLVIRPTAIIPQGEPSAAGTAKAAAPLATVVSGGTTDDDVPS